MSEQSVLITQGELAVVDQEDKFISTLLGSCVACCLWDPLNKVGGMNHMLLAVQHNSNGMAFDLAGATEMDRLINAIGKKGGQRANLRAKIFGGARMLENTREIGEANYKFALDYLQREEIPILKASVGGDSALMLRFWPCDGRASVKRNTGVRTANVPAVIPVPATPVSNEVELF